MNRDEKIREYFIEESSEDYFFQTGMINYDLPSKNISYKQKWIDNHLELT